MTEKLTETKKKKIVTNHAEHKQEQYALDMSTYMDSRKEQAQEIIDSCLEALADPEKIKSAKLSEIATALGIVARIHERR